MADVFELVWEEILRPLWRRGDNVLRAVIGLLLIFTALPIVSSLAGWNTAAAMTGTLPFIVVLIVVFFFPVIIGLVLAIRQGRRAAIPILGLLAVLGLESLYCWMVPISAEPWLIVPLLVVVLTMLAVAASARKGKFRTYALRGLGIIFLVLTAIFIIRGWGYRGISWTWPTATTQVTEGRLSPREQFKKDHSPPTAFRLQPGQRQEFKLAFRPWVMDASPGGTTYITGVDEDGLINFPRHRVGTEERDRQSLPRCHRLIVEAEGATKRYELYWREPEHG